MKVTPFKTKKTHTYTAVSKDPEPSLYRQAQKSLKSKTKRRK